MTMHSDVSKSWAMAAWLGLLTSAAMADEALVSPDTCMAVVKAAKGDRCNQSNSLALSIQNQCNQPMDLKFAIERTDGKWSSGVVFGLNPQAINDSAWTCASTGRYRIFARSPGSSAAFPDERGTFRTAGSVSYAVASGESPESACARAKLWGSGRCECEQPRLGTPLYRCRTSVDSASIPVATENKAFPSDQFAAAKTGAVPNGLMRQEVTLTGDQMEAICGAARAIFTAPESACLCTPASTQTVCTMSGLVPAGDDAGLTDMAIRKAREFLKTRRGCGQTPDKDCSRLLHSVALGRRG